MVVWYEHRLENKKKREKKCTLRGQFTTEIVVYAFCFVNLEEGVSLLVGVDDVGRVDDEFDHQLRHVVTVRQYAPIYDNIRQYTSIYDKIRRYT